MLYQRGKQQTNQINQINKNNQEEHTKKARRPRNTAVPVDCSSDCLAIQKQVNTSNILK